MVPAMSVGILEELLLCRLPAACQPSTLQQVKWQRSSAGQACGPLNRRPIHAAVALLYTLHSITQRAIRLAEEGTCVNSYVIYCFVLGTSGRHARQRMCLHARLSAKLSQLSLSMPRCTRGCSRR